MEKVRFRHPWTGALVGHWLVSLRPTTGRKVPLCVHLGLTHLEFLCPFQVLQRQHAELVTQMEGRESLVSMEGSQRGTIQQI